MSEFHYVTEWYRKYTEIFKKNLENLLFVKDLSVIRRILRDREIIFKWVLSCDLFLNHPEILKIANNKFYRGNFLLTFWPTSPNSQL